jgi:hypothetical protein
MRWPNLRIVFALWNAPADLLEEAALERLGADAVVNSVNEAVRRVHRIVARTRHTKHSKPNGRKMTQGESRRCK